MTPRKNNPNEPNPVLTLRIPAETMRQIDELCQRYNMNRNQVILMLIAKEYGKIEPDK
jgi:NRPS condensation-like uncharacterized protein